MIPLVKRLILMPLLILCTWTRAAIILLDNLTFLLFLLNYTYIGYLHKSARSHTLCISLFLLLLLYLVTNARLLHLIPTRYFNQIYRFNYLLLRYYWDVNLNTLLILEEFIEWIVTLHLLQILISILDRWL